MSHQAVIPSYVATAVEAIRLGRPSGVGYLYSFFAPGLDLLLRRSISEPDLRLRAVSAIMENVVVRIQTGETMSPDDLPRAVRQAATSFRMGTPVTPQSLEPEEALDETFVTALRRLPELERDAILSYYDGEVDEQEAAGRAGLTVEFFRLRRESLKRSFSALSGRRKGILRGGKNRLAASS